MVEAVEKLVGRIRRNKNDVLSWTLCLLSAGSGGVSIANSLLHTNSLAQSRVVWIVGGDPANMEKRLVKINSAVDIEIQRSAMISLEAVGLSFVLFAVARQIDKKG